MSGLTLITGGARAGKSRFAEQLAWEKAGEAVCYLATAEALDAEMAERIQQHRDRRPSRWLTLEAPRQVASQLDNVPPDRLVLLDCLTMWVSNLLLSSDSANSAHSELDRQLDQFLIWSYQHPKEVLVVSNEVGLGVVPPNQLGRQYQDLLGRANQRLASAASAVYLMVAGLPIDIKALAISLPSGE